jgi:hypothetical protein
MVNRTKHKRHHIIEAQTLMSSLLYLTAPHWTQTKPECFLPWGEKKHKERGKAGSILAESDALLERQHQSVSFFDESYALYGLQKH